MERTGRFRLCVWNSSSQLGDCADSDDDAGDRINNEYGEQPGSDQAFTVEFFSGREINTFKEEKDGRGY